MIVRNDPEYSAEATRARVQSMVQLSIIVGEDGKAHDVHVAQGAGFGLDQKAIEAMATWVFKPATKDGHPTAVPANIEMNFHLQVRGGTEDHSGQFARLNFTLPPGAANPELVVGQLPGNPVAAGDQALRIHLQVDVDGAPKNITVLGSTDKAWEQKALRVIRTWRFRPASVDGVAVAADGVFELAHSAPPESEPMFVERPNSERLPSAPRVVAPLPVPGLTARTNHTATLLANGTVLITGGSTPESPAHEMTSAQTFDLATRMIANTGNMLTARQNHTATLLKDGSVLIAGGMSGGHALSSTEIFDPSTGKFSPGARMHEARSSHAAILLPDGRVLICGGTGNSPGAEIYDPRAKAFVPAGAMTVPRTFCTAVALKDGRVLLLGGAGAKAEIFNSETGTFSATADTTVAPDAAGAALLDDGRVLIAGGSTAEIFDPSANTFRAIGALPAACEQCAAIALTNPKVLLTGTAPETEIYDRVTGAFSFGPVLADVVGRHTATLLENGSVLVVGGSAELLTLR